MLSNYHHYFHHPNQNFYVTPKRNRSYEAVTLPPRLQPLVTSITLLLWTCLLEIYCKWNHIICVLFFWSGLFHVRYIFSVHPCCSMWQTDFLPNYSSATTSEAEVWLFTTISSVCSRMECLTRVSLSTVVRFLFMCFSFPPSQIG